MASRDASQRRPGDDGFEGVEVEVNEGTKGPRGGGGGDDDNDDADDDEGKVFGVTGWRKDGQESVQTGEGKEPVEG